MKNLTGIVKKYNETSLILRILIGMIIGIILALIFKGSISWIGVLGDLFVGALKGIAPVLVFVLVSSALAKGTSKLDRRFGLLIFLYLLTTFTAGTLAVIMSFLFPQTIVFTGEAVAEAAPQGIGEVLSNLALNCVQNPVKAISEANYIGILLWAVLFGMAMKNAATDEVKSGLVQLSEGISVVVRWIINLAPFGIMGLVYTTVSTNGIEVFTKYGTLLLLLVSTMLLTSLVINPIIVGILLHTNPYPLVLKCLKESGLTALFTRSSAANIPINMALCEKMGLDEDMYSVAIPLGATINMDGAAITISIMTLAAAHTLGISVDIPTAIVLCVLSAIAACGASGIAGGSLLLIPLACSIFGISNDIAMQVVAIGYIIGVVQDSVETALNSSGDAVFAATAEFYEWRKSGRELPDFLYTKHKLRKMGRL